MPRPPDRLGSGSSRGGGVAAESGSAREKPEAATCERACAVSAASGGGGGTAEGLHRGAGHLCGQARGFLLGRELVPRPQPAGNPEGQKHDLLGTSSGEAVAVAGLRGAETSLVLGAAPPPLASPLGPFPPGLPAPGEGRGGEGRGGVGAGRRPQGGPRPTE